MRRNDRVPTRLKIERFDEKTIKGIRKTSFRIAFLSGLSVQFSRHRARSDSSTAFKTVTSMRAQPFSTRSVASRIIGWALLVFILYGTTVEAAHRHGRLVPAPSSTSITQTQDVDGSIGSKSSCNDCLICQLHQNFSASLISLRLHADALGTQITVRESAPISTHTRVKTPRKGRAPPTVN